MHVFHVKHVLKNEEILIKAGKPFEMCNVPRETMDGASKCWCYGEGVDMARKSVKNGVRWLK